MNSNPSTTRSNKYADRFFRLMQTMQPFVCYNIRFGACTTFIQFPKGRILTIRRDNTLEYKNHKFSPDLEYIAPIQGLADILYFEGRTGIKVDMPHIMNNFHQYAGASSIYRVGITAITTSNENHNSHERR